MVIFLRIFSDDGIFGIAWRVGGITPSLVHFFNRLSPRLELPRPLQPLPRKPSGRMLPVAKFLVQDWEALADSVIGSLYRPSRPHKLTGRYVNPKPESTISLQSGTKNCASLLSHVAPLPFPLSTTLYNYIIR
jgi:hypothetical protein